MSSLRSAATNHFFATESEHGNQPRCGNCFSVVGRGMATCSLSSPGGGGGRSCNVIVLSRVSSVSSLRSAATNHFFATESEHGNQPRCGNCFSVVGRGMATCSLSSPGGGGGRSCNVIVLSRVTSASASGNDDTAPAPVTPGSVRISRRVCRKKFAVAAFPTSVGHCQVNSPPGTMPG